MSEIQQFKYNKRFDITHFKVILKLLQNIFRYFYLAHYIHFSDS